MDQEKKNVVNHKRLKPYHGLKRPPGYYCALVGVKRDAPPISLWVERLTSVPKVVGLCRLGDGPPLSALVCPELTGGRSSWCRSHSPKAEWLCSGVLSMSSLLSMMFQCVKCDFCHRRADEVVHHFLKEHLNPSEVPFVCDQCQFRKCTR